MVTPLRIKEYRNRRETKRQALPKVECACGCGILIPPVTKNWKPTRYLRGHSPHPPPPNMAGWNRGLPAPWSTRTHKGKKKSLESILKRTISRRANHNGLWQVKRGWKQTAEARARMAKSQQARIAREDYKNPFRGKKHTPESRAKMSASLSGEKNPGWNGGASTLPYGIEFTRKFKRLIRERDNYTCQRCGKKQKDHWRALEIHHIDHCKKNNQPDNVTTVCGSCNVWLSYHRDEPFTPLNHLS